MKKFIIVIILGLVSISAFANIITKKEGNTLVVEFYKSQTDSITLDDVQNDFYNAINIAKKKRVTNIFFRDTNKNFFHMIIGKDEINNIDKCWNDLNDIISNYETNKFIQGEIISKKIVRKQISGPKYRSVTTINGRNYSTYESDWDGGYFSPENSTYTAGGDVIKTKTMYVPPKYANVEEIERAPGYTIITPGIVNFVNKIYFNK